MSYYLALIILLLSLFSLNTPFTNAQAQNLLQDPSFEASELKVIAQALGEDASFAISPAWEGWYTTTPRDEEWQNRFPNATSRLNHIEGYVRSGERSMEISRGFSTFTAAVYQVVDVPTGATVQASAWYVMDIGDGANAQARIGIHPSGGRSITDNEIIWSDWSGNQPITDGWKELTLETTARNNRVTVILYTTQTVPTNPNAIFWDDASLIVTAAPQPTPIPIPQTSEPEQQTQEPVVIEVVQANPDGSIVHQTRDGETAIAIASAYGIPLNRLLTLNPSLGDGSLIRAGMLLTIQPKPESEAPRPTNLAPATFTPAPTAEGEPTAAIPITPTTRLCVYLYDDANHNGQHDLGEIGLSNGQVRLESAGQLIDMIDMTGKLRATCFDDLLEGEIRVIVELPDGYQMVNSSPQRMVNLQAGAPIEMVLGAITITQQPTSIAPPPPLLESADEAESGGLGQLQKIGLILFLGAGSLLLIGGGIAFGMSKRKR